MPFGDRFRGEEKSLYVVLGTFACKVIMNRLVVPFKNNTLRNDRVRSAKGKMVPVWSVSPLPPFIWGLDVEGSRTTGIVLHKSVLFRLKKRANNAHDFIYNIEKNYIIDEKLGSLFVA